MYRYMEIASHVEEGILRDKLKAGDQVPSVRSLCRTYQCHQSTAVKALNYLKDKGLLYSKPQSGYYVAGGPAREVQDSPTIDFKSASPDPRFFPYEAYQICLNQAIEQKRSRLFAYGDAEGYEPLKRAISSLVTQDFIFADPSRIVLTAGIQQSLTILTQMDLPGAGRKILIEQPSYHCYIAYLKLNHMDVITIDRTWAGIDLQELEAIFKTGEVKFFYTMARVHNILGTPYSKSQKEQILALAKAYGVYIVEDDYMGDYVVDKTNDPLVTYDTEASHVIYLRSFSKSIFPGLRVGFAILPKNLVKPFAQVQYYRDMGTSLLSQVSLDLFLRNKMYERHIGRMTRLYGERASILRSSLEARGIHNPDPASRGQAIIHTAVKVDRAISQKRLMTEKIQVEDLAAYFYEIRESNNHLLMLNVSNVDKSKIQGGINRLFDVIEGKKEESDYS